MIVSISKLPPGDGLRTLSARALILMAAFDLEPLPPWDELPWFKLEQAWYFARWNRIKARAPRAQRFCVEREGSRADKEQ